MLVVGSNMTIADAFPRHFQPPPSRRCHGLRLAGPPANSLFYRFEAGAGAGFASRAEVPDHHEYANAKMALSYAGTKDFIRLCFVDAASLVFDYTELRGARKYDASRFSRTPLASAATKSAQQPI